MIAPLPLDILLIVLSFCSGDDMHILPPLSVVDHAIYQSSHTDRKRISALKHPPFNISRPSLLESLELHRDEVVSFVSFVHAWNRGVSLHNLRRLHLCGSIGDAEMVDLSGAFATGSMANLTLLWLDSNKIGDAGMISLSEAIGKGSLPALERVIVQTGHENHLALVAACKPRKITIV